MRRNEFQVDFYVASVAEISPDIPETGRSFSGSADIWDKG